MNEHQRLALWAADCAERVLSVFEIQRPGDDRPRLAIDAARAWVRGDLPMVEARRFAFAAHAAARECEGRATFAARAAGHAAATSHVATHAPHAAAYAAKASADPQSESAWQASVKP